MGSQGWEVRGRWRGRRRFAGRTQYHSSLPSIAGAKAVRGNGASLSLALSKAKFFQASPRHFLPNICTNYEADFSPDVGHSALPVRSQCIDV